MAVAPPPVGALFVRHERVETAAFLVQIVGMRVGVVTRVQADFEYPAVGFVVACFGFFRGLVIDPVIISYD